ncbi:hypothetical protein SETIT_6G235300v2 [Setaria italica]|uniref:KIB1-4 beta-propeller domain-containing protein n=3 Tax=Setaria italica TaxID=4555 RepID=A0A368RPK8_SETIT|nr:hypothetical protein SETIT_6G235300v2 [Setaria italica]
MKYRPGWTVTPGPVQDAGWDCTAEIGEDICKLARPSPLSPRDATPAVLLHARRAELSCAAARATAQESSAGKNRRPCLAEPGSVYSLPATAVSCRGSVLFNPVTGTFRRIKKFPGEPHPASPVPVVPLGVGGDSFFHAGRNEVGVWRAEDDKWTVRHVGYAVSLRMAALCGGSVYALDTEGYTFKIELPSLYATKVAAPSLRDKHHTALAGAVEKGYLVEAGGKILFVWPLYTTSRVRGKRDFDPELFDSDDDDGEDDYFFDDVTTLSGFDVYRLDMEEMRWVEDRLAGDVALFVSRWSSFSVRASEKGCVSNRVYFVCDEGAGNTWGAFSLAERRMLFEHAIGAGIYKERLWFYLSPKEPDQEDMDRRLDEIGYI